MAKYEKTLAILDELRVKQQSHLDVALNNGATEKVDMFASRVKALDSALRLMSKKRQELLAASQDS